MTHLHNPFKMTCMRCGKPSDLCGSYSEECIVCDPRGILDTLNQREPKDVPHLKEASTTKGVETAIPAQG